MQQVASLARRGCAALLDRTKRLGEAGAGLVEYVLLISLIVLVALVAVTYFGDETCEKFEGIPESAFDAAPPDNC